MFVGDCVLGAGSAVFSDLGAYMSSLTALEALAPDALYCGHGPVVGGESSGGGGPWPPAVRASAAGDGGGGGGGGDGGGASGIVTAVGRLRAYAAHRREREAGVLAALRARARSGGGVTPRELARQLYVVEGVPASVVEGAGASVVALHLAKLVADGLAVRCGEGAGGGRGEEEAGGEEGRLGEAELGGVRYAASSTACALSDTDTAPSARDSRNST